MHVQEAHGQDAWSRRWLTAVACGAATMSQRKLSSVNARGGGVGPVSAIARELGVHLIELTDDHGQVLVAASAHPFNVIC